MFLPIKQFKVSNQLLQTSRTFPDLFTYKYTYNLIYGGSLTLLRQGFSNLSGDLQGKLFEGFSLYGLRWPHWVQLFSE